MTLTHIELPRVYIFPGSSFLVHGKHGKRGKFLWGGYIIQIPFSDWLELAGLYCKTQ